MICLNKNAAHLLKIMYWLKLKSKAGSGVQSLIIF